MLKLCNHSSILYQSLKKPPNTNNPLKKNLFPTHTHLLYLNTLTNTYSILPLHILKCQNVYLKCFPITKTSPI